MVMSKMKFNLVEDPWIKVLDKKTTEIKKLTLIEVFTNTSRYSRLSGEMSSQDLAVMRFLLAILTTVYLRFDMDGNAYPWLDKKENFFDIDKFAGEGNIGHMFQQVEIYKNKLF